jgi:hypothetical protein
MYYIYSKTLNKNLTNNLNIDRLKKTGVNNYILRLIFY